MHLLRQKGCLYFELILAQLEVIVCDSSREGGHGIPFQLYSEPSHSSQTCLCIDAVDNFNGIGSESN